MDHKRADFLKSLIGLLHFLCWLCAAFVVGFGEFQRMNSLFGAVVPGFLPIYPTNTLIAAGTIACCVCYLGVLGAMKENRCMIIMFFVLLSILILVELAMGILFMVYVTKLDSYLESDLMGSLQAVRSAQPDTNKTLRDDFDAVHYLFQCCGVHGESDWEGNAPVSCCSQDECDSTPYDTWSEGCLQKLRNWFSHNFRSTGAGVIALSIIQLVCMCVTIPMVVLLSQNRLGYI